MVVYKGRLMFLKFDSPLANDQFISIVILSFSRPHMLKALLESIHEHADMPYEIIVTDDASQMAGKNLPSEVFDCRELTSTMIFNNGVNMGFASSANKGTALANSDYVLFMNDDTLMSGPSLRTIKAVLDRPYIGSFGPWQGEKPRISPEQVQVSIAGIPLQLSSLPSGSSIFAFRKKVWFELGGFPQVYHNGGDIAFLHKMCMRGYFAARNDVALDPVLFRNVDVEQGYQESTFSRSRFDSSYPQIFGVNNMESLNNSREQRIYQFSHAEYEKELGLHATDSWGKYFSEAKIDGENNYDWSKLERFGQADWKEPVGQDLKE
jgi:hypothetical protein